MSLLRKNEPETLISSQRTTETFWPERIYTRKVESYRFEARARTLSVARRREEDMWLAPVSRKLLLDFGSMSPVKERTNFTRPSHLQLSFPSPLRIVTDRCSSTPLHKQRSIFPAPCFRFQSVPSNFLLSVVLSFLNPAVLRDTDLLGENRSKTTKEVALAVNDDGRRRDGRHFCFVAIRMQVQNSRVQSFEWDYIGSRAGFGSSKRVGCSRFRSVGRIRSAPASGSSSQYALLGLP